MEKFCLSQDLHLRCRPVFTAFSKSLPSQHKNVSSAKTHCNVENTCKKTGCINLALLALELQMFSLLYQPCVLTFNFKPPKNTFIIIFVLNKTFRTLKFCCCRLLVLLLSEINQVSCLRLLFITFFCEQRLKSNKSFLLSN